MHRELSHIQGGINMSHGLSRKRKAAQTRYYLSFLNFFKKTLAIPAALCYNTERMRLLPPEWSNAAQYEHS